MRTVHRIADPDDPRLEPYRAVRERDLAGRDGLFVAEVAMPFVDYLNRVFSHGGFPGHPTSPEAWRIRRSLAEGMLPL